MLSHRNSSPSPPPHSSWGAEDEEVESLPPSDDEEEEHSIVASSSDDDDAQRKVTEGPQAIPLYARVAFGFFLATIIAAIYKGNGDIVVMIVMAWGVVGAGIVAESVTSSTYINNTKTTEEKEDGSKIN